MEKGFTLIEVVVAIAILLVAIGISFLLFRSGIQGALAAKHLTLAAHRVQEKAEEIRSLSFAEISSGTFDDGQGVIEVSPLGEDLKKIQVKLNWQEGRSPIQVFTLRSKY